MNSAEIGTSSSESDLFDLYFSGQFLGIDSSQAIINFAKILKTEPNKIQHFFDNSDYLLKQKLTQAEAIKYAEIFEKSGLLLEVRSHNLIQQKPREMQFEFSHLKEKSNNYTSPHADLFSSKTTEINLVNPEALIEKKYKLCFSGQYHQNLTLSEARTNFAQLFQCSLTQAIPYFDGQVHVLKENISTQEREQYIAIFAKNGLIVDIKEQVYQPSRIVVSDDPLHPKNSKSAHFSKLLNNHSESSQLTLDNIIPQPEIMTNHAINYDKQAVKLPISNHAQSYSSSYNWHNDSEIDAVTFIENQPQIDPNEKYCLSFAGRHDAKISAMQARENFAKLFRLTIPQALRYFDGRAHIIRSNLSRDEANTYLTTFHKAGLILSIEVMQFFDPKSNYENIEPLSPEEEKFLGKDQIIIESLGDIDWLDFEGRVGRSLYYFMMLGPIMISILSNYMWGFTLSLLSFFMSLSILIRRLHDGGKSAWYLFIFVVSEYIALISLSYAIISPLIYIGLGLLNPQEEKNQYGPSITLGQKYHYLVYPFILLCLYNCLDNYMVIAKLQKKYDEHIQQKYIPPTSAKNNNDKTDNPLLNLQNKSKEVKKTLENINDKSQQQRDKIDTESQ